MLAPDLDTMREGKQLDGQDLVGNPLAPFPF